MKITANIEKKHFWVIFSLAMAIIGIGMAIAFGTSSPSNFGHSVGEINWNDALPKLAVNGDVGIGTSSPLSELHVNDSLGSAALRITGSGTDSTHAEVVLEATGATPNYRGLGLFMHDLAGGTEWYAGRPYATSDQYQIGRASGAFHQSSVAQASNAFLTIMNNGKVGIGTTSPETKLHVKDGSIYLDGNYAGSNILVFRNTDTTFYSGRHQWEIYPFGRAAGGGGLQFYDRNANRNTLELNDDGRVIAAGDIYAGGDFYDGSMPAVSSGWDVWMESGTGRFGIEPSSSLRYKENIADLNLGLMEVLKLRPVFFDYKKSYLQNSSRQIGLIAEEVNQVSPYLAKTINGTVEGVEYDKLSVVLIKAIQELKSENEALKQQIEDLKKRLDYAGIK